MATTLQEKFALLQQMKKEKELKEAKAKETKRFDIFSIAGVTLPSPSNTLRTGQGPKTSKPGGSSNKVRPTETTYQNSLDSNGSNGRPPPPASVTRTSSATSLKRGHSEVSAAREPAGAVTTTSAKALVDTPLTTCNNNPQLLSPSRSPPGNDTMGQSHHTLTASETTTVAGASLKCPPKKLKRSSMAIRNERQAQERRNSSTSIESVDHAPVARHLGSPVLDAHGNGAGRKYSADHTKHPSDDANHVSSMPLTPTPSPLHLEDYSIRASTKDHQEHSYGHPSFIMESHHHHHHHLHQRGRYPPLDPEDMKVRRPSADFDCGNQSPTRTGSQSPSRSRSRSPMVMSPPYRKASFSSSMSMSPPHAAAVQTGPRPRPTAPPRVIHQLPPRPKLPKLPPEVPVTVSASRTGDHQGQDPRALAAKSASSAVRRQILSYDDL
ncbi:hypothetical protein BGZ94_000166 [Podila epigama]|nr:hypothetical protein BGZ94_000166 [Podila epigama]